MPNSEFETHSFEETIAKGKELGATLKPPILILLTGDLGAGKTTLTKGIASGIGAAREEEITSPTFTLVHRYSGGPVPVYHIDLYRIGDTRDFDTLGLEDVFSESAVVIVEWPDRMKLDTGWPVIQIKLDHVSEDVRRVVIRRETGTE
jgi:tRNA threonylcarbamoyladenosine biosynthesis protein TsaE